MFSQSDDDQFYVLYIGLQQKWFQMRSESQTRLDWMTSESVRFDLALNQNRAELGEKWDGTHFVAMLPTHPTYLT